MGNELHTMPLKCEKLLSSSAIKEMSNEQFGAYMKLLCFSWLNGGYINGNANALRRHCDCIDNEEWQRIEPVIDKWFDVRSDDGKIANSHLLEVYQETMEKSNRRSLAGKMSAEKRWSNGNANAMPTHCEGINNQIQSQSQSQSTRTSHTNVCSVATSEPSPLAATKRRKDLVKFDYTKGDWDWDSIPQALADEWAKAYPAVKIEVEMRRAALWITSKPNRTKRDYNAFLVRWFSRQQERGGTK